MDEKLKIGLSISGYVLSVVLIVITIMMVISSNIGQKDIQQDIDIISSTPVEVSENQIEEINEEVEEEDILSRQIILDFYEDSVVPNGDYYNQIALNDNWLLEEVSLEDVSDSDICQYGYIYEETDTSLVRLNVIEDISAKDLKDLESTYGSGRKIISSCNMITQNAVDGLKLSIVRYYGDIINESYYEELKENKTFEGNYLAPENIGSYCDIVKFVNKDGRELHITYVPMSLLSSVEKYITSIETTECYT